MPSPTARRHWPTGESADHRYKYLLAMTLLEGDVNFDQFDRARWLDDDVKSLMSRIEVEIDQALTVTTPEGTVNLVTLLKQLGEVVQGCQDRLRGRIRSLYAPLRHQVDAPEPNPSGCGPLSVTYSVVGNLNDENASDTRME